MKQIMLLITILTLPGCSHIQEWIDDYLQPTPVPAITPVVETTPAPVLTPAPAKTPAPMTRWRDGRDLDTIQGSGGAVEFWTRNITVPQRPNDDGGYEYIIARVTGRGIRRLLIMSMFARPTRLLLERSDGTYSSLIQHTFLQPLPGPSHWRVIGDGSRLWIELDGKEIWHECGNYRVENAIMTGYPRRGFLGQWAAAQRLSEGGNE